MSLFRLIFELIVLYLVYKLVFDFIIPVARTTKQVKKQFGDMQSRMKEQQDQFARQQQNQQYTHTENSSSKKVETSDYIDFEEIK